MTNLTITLYHDNLIFMIAALFVDPCGPYSYLPIYEVDIWGIERDARKYRGPHPIVAHPPCARWGKLSYIRPSLIGKDEGCFESALKSVRKYGGVLEHPKGSIAFQYYQIKKPTPRFGWDKIGDREWVCELAQQAYGHKAKKETWLYYVGNNEPERMKVNYWVGKAQCVIGGRGEKGSKKYRWHTPFAFRDSLIKLAENSMISHHD